MPVPGVPTLQPVEMPFINPKQAGRVGGSIAELGEESEGMVSQAFQLQAHMRNAQMHVDTIAAGNELDAAFRQMQIDLAKTTDSRAVPETLQHAQDNLNAIQKKWEKSPAAIQIQQNASALIPEMNQHAQMRQIDLMGKEWKAESQIQMQTLLPNMVTAKRNGDKAQQDYINGYVSHIYDQAIQSGLITESDKTIGMNAFEIGVRKEVNEAAINSPNPKERQQAIQQLTKGGSGPLDLTNLSAADTSSLLIHAKEVDRTIDNLNEAHNLNQALNVSHNAFQSPEFQGESGYDNRLKVLDNDDWLKKHGIVADDGSPDRVVAKKVAEVVEQDRAHFLQAQNTKDQQGYEKYSQMIDEGNINSFSQIDLLSDVSPKAKGVLRAELRQDMNMKHQFHTWDRELTRAEAQQKKVDALEASDNLKQQIYLNVSGGQVYDPQDLYTMPGLTTRDRNEIISAIKPATGQLANPYIKDGLKKILELESLTPSAQGELAKVFMDEVKTGDLRGSQITDAAGKLIDRAKERDATEWINNAFQNLSTPASRQRLRTVLTPSFRQSTSAPPTGYDVKVPGKDGKLYWGNSRTHEVGPEAQ